MSDCISREALQEWIKDKTFGDIVIASEHNFDCLPPVEPERTADLTDNGIPIEEYTDCVRRKDVLWITKETGALETQARVVKLPSVDPERKTGKWVSAPKGNTIMVCDEMADISLRLPTALCSSCSEVVPVMGKWKRYCPMCGAQMEVDE